ncbi:MAG: tetratricopeptide repeat protein [Acidobacteria bacterium]|nr:tetratricopeptide repeat protein [Acidobacteriota bacterium]
MGRTEVWVLAAILLLTALAYSEVWSFKFVYDDSLYITQNTRTLAGLNRDTLAWAFTCFEDGSYLPLVWLSHAACVSLFGSNPAGHHLVNLGLHLLNTALLLLLLRRITGNFWPSAAVAALFALHPLHVESVAWVSERKDVLSMLFWLLATGSYVRYVRRPSWRSYGLLLLLFALGLLSKTMLVTLPLTLLLLDFWPLGRMGNEAQPWRERLRLGWKLLPEKLPLLLLALIAGSATLWAQRIIGAMSTSQELGLRDRFMNVLRAYWKYLELTVWPNDLSPFYPHPGSSIPWWVGGLCATFLAGMTALAVQQARRRPFMLVGWLWYLVTLLPVSGLVQVGAQAHADRYTYVPLVGIFLMVAWLGKEGVQRARIPRMVLLTASGLLAGALVTLTVVQASRWKDTPTLFGHALSLDPKNEIAYCNLGTSYQAEGRYPEAIAAFTRGIAVNPNFFALHFNLGDSLERVGQTDAALASFRQAARLKPPTILPEGRLAHLLVQKGRFEEALPILERIFRADPRTVSADPVHRKLILQISYLDMGIVLQSKGKKEEALARFRGAVDLNPNYGWAHGYLGTALSEAGRHEEALEHLRKATALDSSSPTLKVHLARGLARAGRIPEARQLLESLLKAHPGFGPALEAMGSLRGGP